MYTYRVSSHIPAGKNSPMPLSEDLTDWLNREMEEGWEFVSPIYRFWHDHDLPQQFYVFRKPMEKMKPK